MVTIIYQGQIKMPSIKPLHMRLLRKPNNHTVKNKTLSLTERQKSDSGPNAGIKRLPLAHHKSNSGEAGKEKPKNRRVLMNHLESGREHQREQKWNFLMINKSSFWQGNHKECQRACSKWRMPTLLAIITGKEHSQYEKALPWLLHKEWMIMTIFLKGGSG